jgi:hypothetical protein
MYFEGGFEHNKPVGKGQWVFKNGNVLHGEYDQKKKEPEEGEEEPPEEEEGAVKKDSYTLTWTSDSNIAAGAHKVNSVD